MADQIESSILNMQNFEKKLDDFVTKVKNDLLSGLENHLKDFKNEMHCVLQKVDKLEQYVNLLENRIEKMEIADRHCDLIVTGIPITINENVMNIIKKIGDTINYDVENIFCQAFRIKPKSAKYGVAPPIIIKFPTRLAAIEFFTKYRAKNNLSLSDIDLSPNTRIYINFGLTAKNNSIFNEAMKIKKTGAINKVYVKSGLVYVVAASSSQPILLNNMQDIYSISAVGPDSRKIIASKNTTGNSSKSCSIETETVINNLFGPQQDATGLSTALKGSKLESKSTPSMSASNLEKRQTRLKSSSSNKGY